MIELVVRIPEPRTSNLRTELFFGDIFKSEVVRNLSMIFFSYLACLVECARACGEIVRQEESALTAGHVDQLTALCKEKTGTEGPFSMRRKRGTRPGGSRPSFVSNMSPHFYSGHCPNLVQTWLKPGPNLVLNLVQTMGRSLFIWPLVNVQALQGRTSLDSPSTRF